MSNKIYVGDVGTEIILDAGVDITAATVHSIDVKKPGSTSSVQWSAEIFETTKLKYVVQDGDLDVSGNYALMANVTMPGWSGHGDTVVMTVHDLWK